jgi:electron transfer flavoprotein alpha subunit
MRIAVCVKMVPVLSRMKFDVESKRVIREGVPTEVNPFDLLAVRRAVELRNSVGGDVTVYTMGPPQSKQALVQCLAIGADQGIHLMDLALAGSDTLATSRALSLALSKENYDLILFGQYSVDGETGQVGPEVAELLHLPLVTGIRNLEIDADGLAIVAERDVDEGSQVLTCQLPAVVSVCDGVADELYPRRAEVKIAGQREIPVMTASQLSSDISIFGTEGSPTWVAEFRLVESHRAQHLLDGMEPIEAAKRVIEFLKSRDLLDPERKRGHRTTTSMAGVVREQTGPGVWVVAEMGSKGPKSVTYELLSAAHNVAEAKRGHVACLLMGGAEVLGFATDLVVGGADVVYFISDEVIPSYNTEAYASNLVRVMHDYQPYAVLFPSTLYGREIAGRVAARLGLGLTGDCIGLEVDREGRLVQMKPAFGGNVVAPILSKTVPYMATIRPGLLERLEPNPARKLVVIHFSGLAINQPNVRLLSFRAQETADVEGMNQAWAVVGVGMGLGGAENLPAINPLLGILNAALACTRDVVYAGWLPAQRQVGLSGMSVAPDLYVAVGIRGNFNHLVGIQRAGTVLAINNDKRADIFQNADIGVVDDWQKLLPALVNELQRELRPN